MEKNHNKIKLDKNDEASCRELSKTMNIPVDEVKRRMVMAKRVVCKVANGLRFPDSTADILALIIQGVLTEARTGATVRNLIDAFEEASVNYSSVIDLAMNCEVKEGGKQYIVKIMRKEVK